MNLTKKEFGELGGVTDVSQGRYEEEDPKKRRMPDIGYLFNLQKHGIDIGYLLTGKTVETDINAEESLLLETYRRSNKQSKKLILDLCSTLSGLPNQSGEDDDDQDPSSGGSKSISGISAGGSVGDVMLDSTKSTTNNYVTTDFKKDYKLNFTWEETNEKISKHERQIKALANIIILFCLMSFLGEMLSYDFAPKDMAGQITEFFLVVLLPVAVAYGIYREASKKITQYFNEKRKRTKREIYL